MISKIRKFMDDVPVEGLICLNAVAWIGDMTYYLAKGEVENIIRTYQTNKYLFMKNLQSVFNTI